MEAPVPFWKCNGCRDCEMACSFRAAGMFWRPASAIQVRKGTSERGAPYTIVVDAVECDLCGGESMPRCQAVCRAQALNPDVLRLLRSQSRGLTLH